MKVVIDTDAKTLEYQADDGAARYDLYSKDAFEIISQLWLKIGWNEKYSYTFTWLGRPIIQLPEDMIRIQEVIYRVKPDVIIETGVAHGGSLIYYAGLCKMLETGRVIGVDIKIHAASRRAIESHELGSYITLIEGDSASMEIVQKVKSLIQPGQTVLVVLDSNHTRAHVLAELEAYHGLVTPGSYIIATDGIMKDLHDTPRGRPEWQTDNPTNAAIEFAALHPNFVLEQPAWPFNEGNLEKNLTHWPDGYLRRL